MLNLLGEYHCRIDAKGRVSFPAKLRKQLDRVLHDGLVVNRDIFEGCLVIYPKPEWDKVNAEMSRLSRYDRSHQLFQRKFMKGATLVEVDGSGRLLVPAALLGHAGLEAGKAGDCVVTGLGEKIEVWSKARFEQQVLGGEDDFDFGALAEKVRQDIDPARNPNDSAPQLMSTTYHVPVLFDASLDGLALQPGGTYVDCTFGGGGHSRGILERLGPEGRLFGFDCDPDAADNVPDDPRFHLIPENFRFASNFLRLQGVQQVDGILADLGVSSHQFDAEDRGFSTRGDGGLDMRMDPRLAEGADALLRRMEAEELTRLFRQFGELPQPHKAARAILKALAEETEDTLSTGWLQKVLGPLAPPNKRNQYLAQAFQALRIAVNDELGALADLLRASLRLLKPGGRLVVISYHSLEDRMVKRFMRAGNLEGDIQKDFKGRALVPFDKVTGKALVAGPEEMVQNPRSRSARLRVAARNTLAA